MLQCLQMGEEDQNPTKTALKADPLSELPSAFSLFPPFPSFVLDVSSAALVYVWGGYRKNQALIFTILWTVSGIWIM